MVININRNPHSSRSLVICSKFIVNKRNISKTFKMNFNLFSRIFTTKIHNRYKLRFKNVRWLSENTIFSLSSGYGKCGVSVIRVSGPNTLKAIKALIPNDFNPKPRFASLKNFQHPKTGEILDRGIILWFPGPNSFTGEDSCEFQVHGSIAVVEAMHDALSNISGLRMALPGEFTKRAFFSGKLDLTEVEGLADLIHAETEAQRKQALLQSTGSLSQLYKNWRKRIIRCVAHMEAYIDFSEDENIEDDILDHLIDELKNLLHEMKQHLNDQRQGELLRNGVRTVIIGAPNVGKSSFLNLICQRQISIVTSIAGTTRDIIESSYNIGGYPVIFADTAGLRKQTDDIIESEGIYKAIEYIKNSDLIILMIDATDLLNKFSNEKEKIIDKYQKFYLNYLGINELNFGNKNIFTIVNKIDLINTEDYEKIKTNKTNDNLVFISCKENFQISEMLGKLKGILKKLCGQPSSEHPRLTNSRYRQHLKQCIQYLEDFLENYNSNDINIDYAIAAQKLRFSIKCIEQITGEIRTDDILDVIFKDFCIGK